MTGLACLFSVRNLKQHKALAAHVVILRAACTVSQLRPAVMLFSLEGEGKWFRNIDYYRLDGSTNALTRKKWAEEFNDTSNVR